MEKVRPLAEIFWRVSVRWWESYRNLMIAVERFMTTFCKFELIDDGETEGGVLIMEMAIVSFSRLLLEVGQSVTRIRLPAPLPHCSAPLPWYRHPGNFGEVMSQMCTFRPLLVGTLQLGINACTSLSSPQRAQECGLCLMKTNLSTNCPLDVKFTKILEIERTSSLKTRLVRFSF